MPGAIAVITSAKVSGWAIHPFLREYKVVVHVVYKTRILCSSIADQPSPSIDGDASSSWFNISLSDFQLQESELKKLSLLIGETDEILDATLIRKQAPSTVVVVEDLINANIKRSWVTGATYIEGLLAGLADADIIDLLYRDILGRPADPEGLANYLFQRREGIRSLNDIRKSLFDSDEYAGRPKDAAHAPGAIFSQPIAMLAAEGNIDTDETSIILTEEALEKPLTIEPAHLGWPSYPERHIPASVRGPQENLEIELPLDSVLFGTGWHNVEYLNNQSFRWMETTGIIFNPKPEFLCLKILITLEAVYGAHMPMVDCYFDDVSAELEILEKDRGFLISVTPTNLRPYAKLRIESRISGCPVQEDRGIDQRVLSLNVISVVMTYRSSGFHSS